MSSVDQPRAFAEHSCRPLGFETLLADVSSRLINLRPDQVDREIGDALRRVCELFDIDLAVLWQWSQSASHVIAATHVHLARAEPSLAEPLRQEQFPWCRQQVLTGRPFAFSAFDDLPAEASVDRETFQRYGIRSGLGLPLFVGGDAIGLLGFNALETPREWPEPLVHQLQLVAQVFGNALARKRHELILQESEEISRATFEQAALGIAHVAANGRFLRVNDKLCTIVGYPREELLGLSFQDITHADDLEAALELVRQVLSGGITTYSIEKRYIRRNRSLVWVNLTVSLVRTAAGEPRHLIAVVEDITTRRRAEEALRISEARLAAGADLAGLAFYEVDLARRAMYVDNRLRDLCGIPPEREQGLGVLAFWMEHVHPDDRQRVFDGREDLHSGRIDRLTIEYRYRQPARGEIWIDHLAGVAARDTTGRATRTFGVFRDITERRQAEEALRQSYAEIERLKDRLQAESDYLKAEISVTQARGELTGRSAAIQKVRRQVEQVASTDSSVLVRGETGSGKELVAQAIHRLSSRRSHVMVKVNCAALPSGLVESELFGREKGAFTGALTRQAGRFEIADGSTIFLDEIGELSLEVQAKLLRVLEAGEFERLGSPRTIKVDARLIAATNRNLADAIKQGRFREDLYYRLNVFPIRMPPLRERPEDIPLLVWTFLEELNVRMGKKITQVSRTAMEALQRHPWPGNIRELRNVIEHGAIITVGDTLRLPMLDEAAPTAAPPQTLADAEREHILRALERAGWHIKGPKGAAAELGLKPGTLYSRMKKLGIQLRRQTANGSA
jgi:PAS domain S-box-containing protein